MGGKSRKAGGVSRKLVERLKNQVSDNENKKKQKDADCGKVKPKTKQDGFFDEGDGDV